MIEQLTWWKYAHKKEPDIELLEQILNNDCGAYYTPHQTKAIQLKYKAMIAEPTTIEKTMSPEQLFDAGNPLWAREYTIQELYYYFKYRKEFEHYEQVDAIIRKQIYNS